MKGKINILARKTFAIIIATAMSIPTGMMARADETKVYEQGSSVMNIMENPEDDKELAKTQDNTKEIENEHYKIETKAKLDESLEKIIYEIKVLKKANQNEETNDSNNLNLKFTPNPNSNIKGLKVLSAKANLDSGLIDTEVKEKENAGDLNSLLVEAKAYDEIIMEVEADIRQAKENRAYDLYIGLEDGEDKLDSTYNLIVNKKILTENKEEKEVLSLDLNQKENDNLKGEILPSELLGFLQPKDTILWTDYLENFDEEMKKVSYDLKLDNKQEITDTKISIDYYENTKDGFILKKDFGQAVDFAEKIEFEIPQGYIAKLSLKTKIDKKDTTTPNYSLNNRQVKNPRHEKKNADQTKEEAGEDDGESDKSKDSTKEEKDSNSSDTQIVVKDSNGNEIPVEEESPTEKDQPEISALILNKDTLVNNLKEDGKLTEGLESIIEELSEDLNAYNDEKITDQELKDFTKSIVDRTGIEKTDLRYYFEAILSGLNKQKNKAANLNIDEIITYAYPEEKPTADETIENNTEAEEKTPDQKENTTNTTDNKKTEDSQSKEEPEKNQGILSKIKDLMVSEEPTPTSVGEGNSTLENKKFTIRTRFDTSNAGGPIEAGQFFIIHLDEKLKVNDPSTLKTIVYKGRVIATPEYDEVNNAIKYKVTQDINENIQVLLNIPVDYNTENITIGKDGTFTVINKVSGLGVKAPKNLVPQKIDKNGNPAGSIIEPDRDDVIKIIDDKNGNYQVPIDITGEPVVENGEMVGINWSMRVHADQSLSTLGFMANFTTVEGSGLGEISKVLVNGKEVKASDQLKNALGIVDSKHHEITENTQDATYSFYTKVTNKQEKYMIDVSVFLKSKNKAGAVRFVLDQGWPKEKVEEATPTRVGINNRTTIQGKFLANDKAEWTITDAISSGDESNKGMPIADRTLDGDQSVTSGKRAVYGLDANGNMVVKSDQKTITSLPSKEEDPAGTQAVGNIAVYKLDTQLKNSDKPSNYNISGVRISKFRDLYIDQVWNFPVAGMTMPGQDFIAKDNDGKELGKVHVDEGAAGETTRFVTIPNARYWDIDENTHEPSKRENKIVQEFDKDTVGASDGKTYKYNENVNYYEIDTKSQYIQNSAIDITKPNPVTFTVVKVDSKDPSKKLAGAKFKLLGDNQPSIVTDDQGRARFNNVLPGTYTLIEEKAPDGYKLDQGNKTVTISEKGNITVNGSNIQTGGSTNETKLVQHDSYPNWPDYMNAMHYGEISDNGELEFYLYLKPESNNGKDGTNRNTRLNISIPGVDITDVTAYDVSPGYRQTVKDRMEQQNIDGYIPSLGENVINLQNNHKIIGTPDTVDLYTGKTGYQIYFPQERFANDWGFLVKVTAKIGDKNSISLDYDWLTNKDTANQTNLTQNVVISKASGEGEDNQLVVTNEEFAKSPISATKFGDTFDENGKRNRLQGAEFILKDSTGRTIANKFTDENGTADFGQFPPGRYRLEEVQAPDGYQKNGVYFDVTVDEQGQVTYKARFEDGIGTPEAGRDYYIEKGKETGDSKKATVTNVNQRLEYLENEPGDIGVQTGVWEAYRYESLKYHADITLSNSAPGSRFEIQFDRNLDFTQYFSEFPKIVINGVEVADPYFDYDTNLLTYVFNNKSKGGPATASINLRGIIPDKYYAKETKTYPFTIKVAPGEAGILGNPVLNKDINADYGPYDSGTNNSNQFYYFRDVYQKEDGKWYVTVMAYLNPMGFSYGSKTTQFNWITTDFQSNQQIARWSGKGYEPLYKLEDVKVYGTDFASYRENEVWKNPNMPPSFGVRPEQDPNIYNLLAHQRINSDEKLNIRENGVTINYDPNQIKTSGRIDLNHPLKVTTPAPRDKGGYIIEQTYKITDIDQFNKKWRAFHMTDGNLESAFASRANVNTAIGDQAGGEIPKYYREIIGLINNKYTSGSFKLTKYDETNEGKKLQNAAFALTDENGKVIYRTSDANGEVNFKDIAPGRYTLEETRAPEGYQLTNKKWQVTVLNDGSVRIRETSITGSGKTYTGNEINIPVSNKPAGQKFRVYKKDGDGRPLSGAKFKITDPQDPNFLLEATSDQSGIVEFNGNPEENKNYVLEEVKPPKGYNKLNKKWVLRVENGKTKIYNYSENAEGGQQVQSILGEEGVEWVDVKNRNTSGWTDYDNRWTGWAGNNQNAQFLGTRIVGINRDENYVIQRYVINPESRNLGKTTASIHRQSTRDPNMDWFDMKKFDKDNDIKVFKLDKPVIGLISDIRLASYNAADITNEVINSLKTEPGRYGEPDRLKLDIPETDKPIVIDIKVPYKDANGGVGTGMDWINGNQIYWKSDFYERVYDIKITGPTTGTTGTILGSYVGEDSLDVTNDIKTYGFEIKKVKEDKTTVIPGTVFKLTGPDGSPNERYMTTGKDGIISFNNLKPGKYKLEETEPAPGYEKTDTTWTVRITTDGKVYIKDSSPNASPENLSFEISTPEKSATNNLMRRLQMAGANTELEISENLVDTLNPLRAVPEYIIEGTGKATYGKTDVTTDVINEGNNQFLVKINVTRVGDNIKNAKFIVQLNDYFDFKEGSTTTWRGSINNYQTTRWHQEYNRSTKIIEIYADQLTLRGGTAGIQFRVTANSNLPTGKAIKIINDIPFKANDKATEYTISVPTVTKKGPVITYEEREVRTEIPIPTEPIRRPNDQMYEGEENEVDPGKAGYKIDIYKYKLVDGVDQPNPEFVRTKETVKAEPKIIEYGTKKKGPEQRTSDPVTLTEEIPFEIQESVDENLKPGEVVIDTQGKKGSVQYKYSITYEKSEGTSAERPADWPEDAPKAQPQADERVISYNKTEVQGTRVNPTTQIVRKGPAGAEAGETEIKPGEFAQITNKQTGLDLKIYKKDRNDRKLPNAIFTIRKTDENFKNPDEDFGVKTGTSNADGLVEFKDKEGKPLRLQVGYYLIEETAAPLGYRKPNAPWKVQVVEEDGKLVAKYKGPEETPQSFVEKNEDLGIKTAANGIKYATKITHIDTEARSYVQRVYIDTRAYKSSNQENPKNILNVQINPKHKRKEIDRAGKPPVTIKEGVKTAYRSTYKITGLDGNPNEAQMIKILNDYDTSNPNVSVVNTARWRPFDWGFDEDQLNLEPGVYYIDIEGFYDTSIIDRNVTNEVAIDKNYNFTQKDGVTPSDEPVLKDSYVNDNKTELPDEDLGKIDINIEFFDGAREFQQLYITENNTLDYKTIKDENGKDEASYQDGVLAVKQWLEKNYNAEYAKNWFGSKKSGQKYVNQLSKEIEYPTWYNNQWYMVRNKSGRIIPPIVNATPASKVSTSMNIRSLYSSQKENTVPQEGLSVVNDAERYNITFSKHGRDKTGDITQDEIGEITQNRLEGAVFRLEKRVREGIYEPVEGSYVSSAFNGYFGFRNLEPGRYRLIEVQAPKGYKPIDGPLLHFSVETVSIASQRITDPRTGENMDVKKVEFYFPGNTTPYKFTDLEMRDPTDPEKTIKFMNATNVDLKTTRIINPKNKETDVALRDLSIKFPDIKNSANKVLIPAKTYKISEIQITPSSNGYISLEYDGANGVYQYVPEKSSTEKNGKLIDFVTSATAKNMGKIVDEKPGKGNVTIEKYDEDGHKLIGKKNEKGEIEGSAKFKLTNQSTGKVEGTTKAIGEDGSVTFEGLQIGNYKLEEVKSPDGYINPGHEWHFTVGGKELDPYSEDIAPTGRDLSGQIKLTDSKMSVVSPLTKDGSPSVKGEYHPHLAESLVFDNKYKVPEGIKINPGDFFKLQLKDTTDLYGVFENSIDNLDIFADGVGTIAKANYNRQTGTITYTFTKYADTYELKEISNKMAAFVNLNVVRQSTKNVPFGFSINGVDKTSKVNVVYDLKPERKDDGRNFINYTSKIVKYNPETGEFVHYFYINRDRMPLQRFDFNFLSDQNLSNVVVTEYKVLNNLEDAMPESFGVDENSNNLSRGKIINSTNDLQSGKILTTPYYNGVTRDGSYIVKITGRVSDKDKSEYVGYSHIIHYYGNGRALYADRFDAVHQFVNESSADVKLTIKAVNPANRIKFKKVGNNSEALKGATFQLYKKENEGNWNAYEQPIETKEDGIIEYSKLPKGEYQLLETKASEGYVKADGILAEFKVDESGKVFRKEYYKDEKGQKQERFIEEPGVVPITLVNNKENEVTLKKVDPEGKLLPDAEFEVWYKKEETGNYNNTDISLYKDASGIIYALKSTDSLPTGYTKLDKLISGTDGTVKFKVNEPGYYAIKEIKAPNGYIKEKGEFVKEFVVKDGVVQQEYNSTMDVDKEIGNIGLTVYDSDIVYKFNPKNEDITYIKDKSKLTLSGLPESSQYGIGEYKMTPITITAYLLDKNDNKSEEKNITLTAKDYNYREMYGSTTINLYNLVKELENNTDDSDITSNKTLVFKMNSKLKLGTKLDIKSDVDISDKVKETRTFHIGTKVIMKDGLETGEDHSFTFNTLGEMEKDNKGQSYIPIEIVNRKVTFPLTSGINSWLGYTIIGLVLMTIAGFIYNRKKNNILG